MEAYKYFSASKGKMGILRILTSIKDAYVIEFGPTCITNYEVCSTMSLTDENKSKVDYINIENSDIVSKRCNKLEQAIIELDNGKRPKYIFIVESCKSCIMGEDILNICDNLKERVHSKLLFINASNLNYDYNKAIEIALELASQEIVKPNEKNINKYNIMGFSVDKYNYFSDVEELQRIMSELFNKDVNSIFTINSDLEHIKNAANASLNIVARKEALKAAQYMKEEYGIPYVYKNLYGFKNIIKFVETVKQIDGYELDEDKYNKEINFVKKHVFEIKRKFYFYEESKDCAVFGDFDTVSGISDMLKELGFNVDRKEVLYKTNCIDEEMLGGNSELDRINYLNNKELLILLGDGPIIETNHNSKVDLQISNLNSCKVKNYSTIPYIGFRGCVYIIDEILKIKC